MSRFRWLSTSSPFEERPFRRVFERVRRPLPPDPEIVTAYTDGQVTLRSNRSKEGYHEAADLSGFQGVDVGDFVVHGLDILRGSVGVADSAGALSSVCIVCVPRVESDPRFFAYAMRAQAWAGVPRALAKGVREGGADFRRWETLADLPLPVPSLSEQRALADYLDAETARIDALISKKRRLIELLQDRWRELRCAKMLCGLDPVHGGGLHEPWHEMNLGVLLELQRGHDLPSDDREDGKIPVVSSGGVSGFHNTAIADGPGVITGRYGTVGEVFFVDTPYWPLNTTLYVKDFRGNDRKWIYHLLASIPLDIDSQKSAVGGINRNIIGSLRVPRPPISEQRTIAHDLDEAEDSSKKACKKLGSQIQLLLERRQAMITAVVAGEMPVLEAAV